MNLSGWLEAWGDATVLAWGGALLGLVFGFAAQRSRFCARAAVLDVCEKRVGDRLVVWLLAFSTALLAVQLLAYSGNLKPEGSRFLAGQGSLSGAILGGFLFGIGMILARGCAGRLLILSANGNLRALISGLVFAVTVQASIGGWLAPARQALGNLWLVDGGAGRSLLSLTGLGQSGGLAVAALMFATAAYLFATRHRNRPWLAAGAATTGLVIAASWGFTQAVANVSFEAVQLQSLNFSGPSAEWLMRVVSTATVPDGINFDYGMLPATFLGSLLGALIGGDFKLEGFKTENKFGHYLIGAVLMGFGAVLAGGCTIGAGMSGGSLFALTAWLTLISIAAGAALSWAVYRKMNWPV